MTRPREYIVLYALLTSLTAISTDALLPALRTIETDLGASPPLSTQHVISLFIFGMVFGELVIGPLSDAIGRKKALLLGLGVYGVGTVAAMLAGSIEVLVLARILQGVGVSGPKVVTRAIIRDQFAGDAMARVLSFMFTLFIFVPMVAPALGQGVVAMVGWRGVFAMYLALAALAGLWLVLRQPETLPVDRRVPFRPGSLVRNGRRILSRGRVSLLIVATGFVFGALLLYLSTAADLFFDAYGIAGTFPLYFAILAGGVGLASFSNARLVVRFGMEAMARGALVGLAAAGLLILAATALWNGSPPLVLFMTLGFAGFFALGILFGNLNAMAMLPLGQLAGLGASFIASGSSLVATLFAVGLGLLYDGTTLTLAIGLLVAGLAALVLLELALRRDPSPVEAVR